MSNGDTSIPKNIDVNVPSVARMYDYYLGGKDNYPADRVACEQLLEHVPSTKVLAVNNRRFLRRVVHHLASEYGIRQFIDHGSGLPTQDNVHQVAQLVDRDSRVVYIDNDPIVLAHGKAILEENDRTAVIQADMRDTEGIFGHPEVRLPSTSRSRWPPCSSPYCTASPTGTTRPTWCAVRRPGWPPGVSWWCASS